MNSRLNSLVDTASARLDPVMVRINELSRVQRLAIFASILVLVGLLFYYLLYQPRSNELRRLSEDIRRTESSMVAARKAVVKLDALVKQREVAEARFQKATRALPEKQEIPELLSSISAAGKESGLDFQLFQPGAGTTREFYEEIPVSITVDGSFHQIVGFFDRVARLSRIVNLQDIGITSKSKDGILSTRCRAVTYRFVEPTQPQKGKRSKRKR